MDRSTPIYLVHGTVHSADYSYRHESHGVSLHLYTIGDAPAHEFHDFDRIAASVLHHLSMAVAPKADVDSAASSTAARGSASQGYRHDDVDPVGYRHQSTESNRSFSNQCADHAVGLEHLGIRGNRCDCVHMVVGFASGRSPRFDQALDGHGGDTRGEIAGDPGKPALGDPCCDHDDCRSEESTGFARDRAAPAPAP